jgi:hypothetical protein
VVLEAMTNNAERSEMCHFASREESCRKDLEGAFGVL